MVCSNWNFSARCLPCWVVFHQLLVTSRPWRQTWAPCRRGSLPQRKAPSLQFRRCLSPLTISLTPPPLPPLLISTPQPYSPGESLVRGACDDVIGICIVCVCPELGIYPAVDPLDSTSRIMDPNIVGEEHYNVARGVQKILQVCV